jgi:AraC-like DNA-binding protein
LKVAVFRHILPIMTSNTDYLLPSIHPSYARLLVAHLRNLGTEPSELFKGNSLSWASLLESQSFISFEQFRRLLERAQLKALEADDRLPLELGISSISQASSHGPLGYGALAAPTVKDTFELVRKMIATRIAIISIESDVMEGQTIFRVVEKFDLDSLRLFVSIVLLSSFVDLIAKTTGVNNTAITVKLPLAELPHPDAYQQKFPNVTFSLNSQHLELVIPEDTLRQRCLTVDEFAYRNALRECEQLLQQEVKGGAFSRRVKTFLLRCGGEFPLQEEAAEHFAVSVRTFIRKLKNEESSYQTLLDEVRKELVVWYLSSDELSIEQIALKVGYADTSNFSRVFRRWFNQTPSEFRSTHE